MTVLMRLLIVAAISLSGCARISSGPPEETPALVKAPEPTPADLFASAEKLILDKNFPDAMAAFKTIQLSYSDTEWSGRAKYAIATIYVSADNPQKDYTAALQEFDEFLTLFPDHGKAAEARSWRLAIKNILDIKRENEKLSKKIEQLKNIDIRQEEKRHGR